MTCSRGIAPMSLMMTRREIFLFHLAGTLTLDLAPGSWIPFPHPFHLLLMKTKRITFLFHPAPLVTGTELSDLVEEVLQQVTTLHSEFLQSFHFDLTYPLTTHV